MTPQAHIEDGQIFLHRFDGRGNRTLAFEKCLKVQHPDETSFTIRIWCSQFLQKHISQTCIFHISDEEVFRCSHSINEFKEILFEYVISQCLYLSCFLVFPLWFEILSAESQDAHSARFDWKSSRCSRFSFARNISRRSQDEGSSSKLSCIVKGRIDKTFLFCYPAASTQPKHKEVFHVEIGRRCSFDS